MNTLLKQKLSAGEYKNYFNAGISYAQYISDFETELSSTTNEYAQYLPMNWQRVSRLNKNNVINEDFKQQLQSISTKLHWLVITEHWCGDASQIVPVIAQMAAIIPNFDLKFVYRDEHPQLIDAHLTNNTARAIPKLVLLDVNFEYLAEWGPRPTAAQQLVLDIKNDTNSKLDYGAELHKWYAKNKQHDITTEILDILNTL